MRTLPRASAILLTACVAVVGGGALPALAAPTDDYPALDAAFANPATVGGVAELGADLTQDLTNGDHDNRLDLAAGQSLVLDLHGHDLTTAAITLGAGSTLTITDTSTGTPGVLTATALPTGYPTNADPLDNRPGIESTGATLVIEGRATVVASGGSNGTAGIGGADDGDGGTILIRGDANVTAYGAQFGAAIGSGDGDAGRNPARGTGPITIAGNARVTAIADDGAAIGGGVYSDGGDITITDNAVVSATGDSGAAIGGGYFGGSNAGVIRIDGNATVEATTRRGAGIGGGTQNTTGNFGADGGQIEIGGTATVTATSTAQAAGIGGGPDGDGGTVTVYDNPTVIATAQGLGAGIGGGNGGSGGDVELLGGTVTAINGGDTTGTSSAIGQGAGGASFGSLHIADPATLLVPSPAVLRVPADVTVTGDGELRGGATPGTVVNNGAVQLATDDVDWSTLGLYPNNYLVTRHANTGTSDQEVRVFATTLAAGARQIPAEPTKADHTLTGWNLAQDGTGDQVTLAMDTPITADVTHFAQWAQNPPAPPADDPEDPEDPQDPAPPTTPTTAGPGVTTITTPARSGALATTGSPDIALWTAIAGGLVLAGGLTVLIVRRRTQH